MATASGVSALNGGRPTSISKSTDAERVEIAARVDRTTLGLLGREVGGSAHHGAGASEIGVGVAEHRRDAEVGDLDLTVAGDQHVARFDVAMDDATAMREPERRRNIDCDLGRTIGVEHTLRADEIGQAATVDELHNDEVRVVLLTPIEDAHDVGVIQIGRCLRFAAEPLHKGGVCGEVGKEHFDGDGPVEQTVASEEDIGHTTARQASLKFVPAVEDGR